LIVVHQSLFGWAMSGWWSWVMKHTYIITHKWLNSLSWMIRAESVNFFFWVFGNFEKFLLEILEKCAISSMQFFKKDFYFIFLHFCEIKKIEN
jgi:hypothetical protein